MSNDDHDDFFIGWNAPPARQARWMRTTSACFIAITVVTAIILAALQRDPGSGSWQDDKTVTVDGLVVCRPYAMLRTPDSVSAWGIRTILLVSEGKLGAIDRVSSVNGQYVRVRGTYLHRDDRWMFELVSDSDAVVKIDPPTSLDLSLLDPPEKVIGSESVLGEVIDPKCYFGAMKPGDGKTHKACASLCISGGIPPMLVTHQLSDQPRYLLLVSPENQPVNAWAAQVAGETINLAGQLARSGDLTYFKIGPSPSATETTRVPTKESEAILRRP
jgi:hypothetical protein